MQQLLEFSGKTYHPAKDGARLSAQCRRVWQTMSEGGWWTFSELHNHHIAIFDVYDSEPSLSARLRQLRTVQCGSHTIERRRRVGANGLHEYRMVKGAKS